MRRLPFATVAFTALVLAVAVLDDAVRHPLTHAELMRLGASSGPTLPHEPWRLLTSVVLTNKPHMTYEICVGLMTTVAVSEWLLGRALLVAAAVASTVVATVGADVLLVAGRAAGVHGAATALRAPDFGASAMIVGVAGALAARLPRFWAGVVVVIALNSVIVWHGLSDLEHVLAFPTGAAISWFARAEPRRIRVPAAGK